ncbi:MAG: V-type sodium ATPase subunit D [Firmicutes bacterium]|nr:V-type sodium ATPase subunit D [candidate division NPL-UPA2 bacterium]MBT9153691.1 V-type sodium ATPase subunit D [candidate division NPL-UPA2 bacterium]MBT9155829.1 V-type sodium ATPase subunit D [candidate division NPL-UPA2 bacterium]
MNIRVNPTRMELLRLKKRVRVAKRGHKLLKDKRDELMKSFMSLLRNVKRLRLTVEQQLRLGYQSFLIARAVMTPEMLDEAIMFPKQRIELEVAQKRMMSVTAPVFRLRQEGDVYAYGMAGTSGELDMALGIFAELLPTLIELAGVERALELLAEEIERTRRRVNALEYVLIPTLEATVKSIAMKLSEQERGAISRLMKIKDVVRAK